jgi:hypothetical protein
MRIASFNVENLFSRARALNQEAWAEGREVLTVYSRLKTRLNDTPGNDPPSPLLGAGSDLRDITEHPQFQSDGRPWTYANGTASNKIDYVLLSPALFNGVTAGGIWRKGVWGGVNGTLFPHYDEMEGPAHAASDHAAIWADIDL